MGASVTLPLLTLLPPASWPAAPDPAGAAQRQQVSGETAQPDVAAVVWVSVGVLWAWWHLLGFTEISPAGTLPLQSPGQDKACLWLVAYISN